MEKSWDFSWTAHEEASAVIKSTISFGKGMKIFDKNTFKVECGFFFFFKYSPGTIKICSFWKRNHKSGWLYWKPPVLSAFYDAWNLLHSNFFCFCLLKLHGKSVPKWVTSTCCSDKPEKKRYLPRASLGNSTSVQQFSLLEIIILLGSDVCTPLQPLLLLSESMEMARPDCGSRSWRMLCV